MSQDSFEARRALRAAQRDDSDDGEDELGGGVDQEQRQDGAVLRPGEEAVHEDGLQPDDAPTGGTKRTRPKLTYEMLTATTGIPTIFGTFREALHRQRSGRGNPTKDLGILLDLYEQWQKQVFPHTDFDTFTKKVAGLYGKPGGKQTTGATLKGDVRELRESVIQVALDNMVESLDNQNAPAQDAVSDEGAAPATETLDASECGQSGAQSAVGIFAAAREAPMSDDSPGLEKACSPDLFDPDELMPLQPNAVEEGDEFDDMLC